MKNEKPIIPVQNTVSKNVFREMISKEKMLNGKSFESCSRMELFEMVMSLAKQVGVLHRQIEDNKFKNKVKRLYLKVKQKLTFNKK